MTEDYPLPDIKTLFHELEVGSKFYVKTDLPSAYYQTKLDDAAQAISVINTTLGLLKLLRLHQGLNNTSGMFQRKIENTFKGLVGTTCFQEDVLVHGRTKSQCEKRWRAVQDHLKGVHYRRNQVWNYRGENLFSVSQFQEAGLRTMIDLSIKSGKSILLKGSRTILRIGQNSTVGSSRISHRKLPQYMS